MLLKIWLDHHYIRREIELLYDNNTFTKAFCLRTNILSQRKTLSKHGSDRRMDLPVHFPAISMFFCSRVSSAGPINNTPCFAYLHLFISHIAQFSQCSHCPVIWKHIKFKFLATRLFLMFSILLVIFKIKCCTIFFSNRSWHPNVQYHNQHSFRSYKVCTNKRLRVFLLQHLSHLW